jgi:hypothetical protein
MSEEKTLEREPTMKTPPMARVQWTKDMWEDYSNATAAERQYLIAKWGDPTKW